MICERYLFPILGMAIILASPALSAPPDVGDPPTIYIGGNGIAPPYNISVEGDVILVNGFQLWPCVDPAPQATPKRTPSPSSVRQYEIKQHARRLWEELLLDDPDADPDEILPTILKYFSAQPEVSAVEVERSNMVTLTWQSDGKSVLIAYPTIERLRARRSKRDTTNSLERRAALYRSHIEAGGIIMVIPGQSVLFPTTRGQGYLDSLRVEIAQAESGTWTGGHLRKSFADALRDPINRDRLIPKQH